MAPLWHNRYRANSAILCVLTILIANASLLKNLGGWQKDKLVIKMQPEEKITKQIRIEDLNELEKKVFKK